MLNINLERKMINPKIFKAVLMVASKEAKDKVLEELMKSYSHNYDYNDEKAGHIIEVLMDPTTLVTPDKVNLKWFYDKDNLKYLMYNHEKYNIRNIKVDDVDNISCSVKITFEYLEKINEDRDDVSYTSSYGIISFIDHPQILK